MQQREAKPAISLRDALGLGLAAVWRHREAAWLLAALFAIFGTANVLINPLLLAGTGIDAGAPGLEQKLLAAPARLWLGSAMMLIASAVVGTLWVRVSTLGPGAALAGGRAALARRSMLILWRVLCGSGWLLLLLLMLFMPLSLLGPIYQPGGALTPINLIQFAIIFLAVALASAVIGVAIITQALDHRFTIRVVFRHLMGANLWPAAGCWVIAVSAAAITDGVISFALFDVLDRPPAAALTLHLYIALTAFINKLAGFAWLSSIGGFARAVIAAEAGAT